MALVTSDDHEGDTEVTRFSFHNEYFLCSVLKSRPISS